MAARLPVIQRLKTAALVGLVHGLFRVLRLLGPDRASALGGFLARNLGRLAPQHRRVGRPNLAAAFPEKSTQEREAILREVWDGLGRTVFEYPFLRDLVDLDPAHPERPSRIEVVGAEHFEALARREGPALVFAVHAANWEVLGVAAAKYGLEITSLFRPPNSAAAAAAVAAFREKAMGRLIATGFGASLAIHEELDRGGKIAMLADQHFSRGVAAPFFGRMVATNPLPVRLARKFDCPLHGARCVRLPGGRFRLEITPPLDLHRQVPGNAGIAAGVAEMNAVIERWVREQPGQWLWLHRRWRAPLSDQTASPGATTR